MISKIDKRRNKKNWYVVDWINIKGVSHGQWVCKKVTQRGLKNDIGGSGKLLCLIKRIWMKIQFYHFVKMGGGGFQ